MPSGRHPPRLKPASERPTVKPPVIRIWSSKSLNPVPFARIIMGADEAALLRLWREKRGEIPSEDLMRSGTDPAPC
jgi:hypothetical protein